MVEIGLYHSPPTSNMSNSDPTADIIPKTKISLCYILIELRYKWAAFPNNNVT